MCRRAPNETTAAISDPFVGRYRFALRSARQMQKLILQERRKQHRRSSSNSWLRHGPSGIEFVPTSLDMRGWNTVICC